MNSGSFARIATVTATTQRAGGVDAGGLSGDMADVEVGFKCTPLFPLTPEVAQMAGLGEFAELLVTFADGDLNILEGKDTFIAGGKTYKVRAVGQWFWQPTSANRLMIILKEVK